MEDGFQDAIAYRTHEHPVEPYKHHRTVGVIDDDVGAHPVEHLTEIDEGKESEEYCWEVGQHV